MNGVTGLPVVRIIFRDTGVKGRGGIWWPTFFLPLNLTLPPPPTTTGHPAPQRKKCSWENNTRGTGSVVTRKERKTYQHHPRPHSTPVTRDFFLTENDLFGKKDCESNTWTVGKIIRFCSWPCYTKFGLHSAIFKGLLFKCCHNRARMTKIPCT